MAQLELIAPAKLNLVLRVGPVRDDGYHPLRSLMVTLTDPHDAVRVAVAEERSVECAEAPGRENLAWAALDALERKVGRAVPVAVSISKGIPAQAGLGGGSSDAAAVLIAANRLHGCGLNDDALEAVAAEVGSDVPFFVRGGAQWAEGRGERLRPTTPPDDLHLVVVFDAAIRLPTGEVYRHFDRAPRPPLDTADGVEPINDLWDSALALQPGLGRVARDLRAGGAGTTLLCGSGAAIAGLFDDAAAARATARLLGDSYRVWQATPTTQGSAGG